MEVGSVSEDLSPMDVDAANLDYDEAADERPGAADAYVQADVQPPAPLTSLDAVSFRRVDDGAMLVSNWVLEHIQALEDKVRNLTERERAVYDELRVLRGLHDTHVDTIGCLNSDLIQYEGMGPNGMDLFATTATGRTWHKDRNCPRLRNTMQSEADALLPGLWQMIFL